MSNRLTVAFDIDGTWTEDPVAWLQTFRHFQHLGHTCIIVTGAFHPQDKLDRLLIPQDAVIINSERKFKKHAALTAGYNVTVWIDDMPGTIEPCRILTDNLK